MKQRIALVLFGVLVLAAAGARADLPARGTIGLYLAAGENELTRAGVVKVGAPFEIVVRTDTEIGANTAIFSVTELNLEYPGIFKIGTWKYNDTTFDLGDNDVGEYVFTYRVCAEAGPTEILRVGYVDINGDLPENVLLYVGGIVDDDMHSRDLDGHPGFVDCDATGIFSLVPEPWDADSNVDPTAIEGVTVTDGLLVLNPSARVPTFSSTIGALKAQF